jgi:c-di-GMP-binding flagellar brake protein YcgR
MRDFREDAPRPLAARILSIVVLRDDPGPAAPPEEAPVTTVFDYHSQRREFVHTNTDIPIRYKFLSKEVNLDGDEIFEGTTSNLAGGGCLLVGRVPHFSWIPALLMCQIKLGINMLLPSVDKPVKSLCKVAWIEEIPEGRDRVVLGLRFEDVTKEDQDQVMKYLIRTQMTK